MFENFENDKLEMSQLSEIKGGNPIVRWALKKVKDTAILGELVEAIENAGEAAINGYIDACASGTYEGIPGCKR